MSGGAYVRVTANKTQRRDGEKIERMIMTNGGEFSWERFQNRGSLQSLLQRICRAASQPKTDETVLCRQAAVMDWLYHHDERCLKSNFFAASLCTRPSCLPLCHVFFVVLRCHSMLSKQCHFSQCCRLWWVNLFKLLNYCLSGKQWQVYKVGINPNMSANAKP